MISFDKHDQNKEKQYNSQISGKLKCQENTFFPSSSNLYRHSISQQNQIDEQNKVCKISTDHDQCFKEKYISYSPKYKKKSKNLSIGGHSHKNSKIYNESFQSKNQLFKSAQDKFKKFIFASINLKKFVIQWMSITSFYRFNNLQFSHFALINDNSIILNPKLLPNRRYTYNITGDTNQKEGRNLQQLISNSKEENVSVDYSHHQIKKTFKFPELLTQGNLKWCDEYFKFLPVLSPSGTFKFIWDFLIMAVIISFIFEIPLEITFQLSLHEMFNSSFLVLCDILLLIDIFLSLNFGYFEKGLPITKRSEVILNYIKNGLIIDFCACTFLSYDILSGQQNQSSNFLHLLFFLKLKSISRIFKKIEERFHFTPKITQISSLLSLLFIIITVAHILGCMWVAVALEESRQGYNSWISKVNLDDNDWFSQYICAYYFATVTMITVGYGDFIPVNNSERVVGVCSMLLSCGVFAYTINSIGEIFISLNKKKKQMKQDLYFIGNFMSKKNVTKDLQYEVREFLEYSWSMSHETDHQKENQLLAQLNPSLKQKLLLETYKMVISQYQLFSNNFSEEFMIKLIEVIEENQFRSDQPISYDLLEKKNDLFFVVSGKVGIYADEKNDKIIKTLSKGDCFGEIGFFSGQSDSLNIKAMEYSTLFSISRSRFISLIKTFPIDYETFCHIQDIIKFQKDFSVLNINCYTCGSSSHTFKTCPSIHLNLNNEKVVNRHFADRSIKQKYPTFILHDLVKERQAELQKDEKEDIFFYLEEYLEIAENSETQKDKSQKKTKFNEAAGDISIDIFKTEIENNAIQNESNNSQAINSNTSNQEDNSQKQFPQQITTQNSHSLSHNQDQNLIRKAISSCHFHSEFNEIAERTERKNFSLTPNLLSEQNHMISSQSMKQIKSQSILQKDNFTINPLGHSHKTRLNTQQGSRLKQSIYYKDELAELEQDYKSEQQIYKKGTNRMKVNEIIDDLSGFILRADHCFEKQKNFDIYLPHNNLPSILQQVIANQKLLKIIKQQGKLTEFSKGTHFYRLFQKTFSNQGLRARYNAKRGTTHIISVRGKRTEQKQPTTKFQKLANKYQQTSKNYQSQSDDDEMLSTRKIKTQNKLLNINSNQKITFGFPSELLETFKFNKSYSKSKGVEIWDNQDDILLFNTKKTMFQDKQQLSQKNTLHNLRRYLFNKKNFLSGLDHNFTLNSQSLNLQEPKQLDITISHSERNHQSFSIIQNIEDIPPSISNNSSSLRLIALPINIIPSKFSKENENDSQTCLK